MSSHYKQTKLEPIVPIETWGLNFCLGNVVKYVYRAGRKSGNTRQQDLEKALYYLKRELEHGQSIDETSTLGSTGKIPL